VYYAQSQPIGFLFTAFSTPALRIGE